MFHFTSRFILLASLASFCFAAPGPVSQRGVSDIQTAIANIASQASTLDSAIQAFPTPDGDAKAAYSILGEGSVLNDDISRATYQIKNTGPLSESDATTILDLLSDIAPALAGSLNGLIAKESAFAGVKIWNLGGFSTLIEDGLSCFSNEVAQIESALIAVTPSEFHSDILSFTAALQSKVTATIHAYQ